MTQISPATGTWKTSCFQCGKARPPGRAGVYCSNECEAEADAFLKQMKRKKQEDEFNNLMSHFDEDAFGKALMGEKEG